MVDIKNYPYFDDFKEAFEKAYKQLLFNPGRPVQARELTQIQSLIMEQMKENFHTIYKNGSIINGLDINIDLTNKKAYISKGKFYYEGRVYEVEAQNLDIEATGKEYLGLQLTEEIITYQDDTSLLDPAQGYTNYGQPGADRLKQTWIFVKIEDPENLPDGTISIWELEDGILQNFIQKPAYAEWMSVLAKRTYDESGNYLVSGMEIEVEDNEDDNTKIDILINPGTCYVKGYEVTLPSKKRITVDKAIGTNTKQNVIFTVEKTNGVYKYFYDIATPYVKELTEVNALVATTIVVTKSDSYSDVFLANGDSFNPTDIQGVQFNNVSNIIQIIDENGTIYTEGDDYTLSTDTSGNSIISWNSSGTIPSPGTSFKVKFIYSKTFQIGTEVDLQINTDKPNYYQLVLVESALKYNFSDALIDEMLAEGTSYSDTKFFYTELPYYDSGSSSNLIYVDFVYYQSRVDLVSVNKDGDFMIKTGEYTDFTETRIPQDSKEYLQLGYVKFMPNQGAEECQIVNYGYKRTTMIELFYALKRLADLEYNQAELALELEAEKDEIPTTLRGILVDNFEDFGKCDTGATDFNCSLSDIDNSLTMAVNNYLVELNKSNFVLAGVDYYSEDGKKTFALKKLDKELVLSNSQKTHAENLNPYTYLNVAKGSAVINPEKDYWYNPGTIKATFKIKDNHKTFTGVKTVKSKHINIFKPTQSYMEKYNITDLFGTNTKTTPESDNFFANVKRVYKGDKYKTFSREKTITVSGKSWEAGHRILLYFDGKPISFDSISVGTLADYSLNGRIYKVAVVNSTGHFSGTFTVPAGTTTGKHTVVCKDIETNYEYSMLYETEGLPSLYQRIIINRSIIKHDMRERRQITIPRRRFKDPIAQSFVFEKDMILTGITLYFKSKDANIPAFLEIGNVVNGYPASDNLLHYQEIMPADVTVSSNGTIGTYIELTKPVYIPANQEFFIGLGSASNNWEVFVSEMGKTDINTGEAITKNPYLEGVFFKSSNNSTWTAFQTMDLTFDLWAGKYETLGTIQTPNYTTNEEGNPLSFSKFIFPVDTEIVESTDCKFYYSVNAGTSWKSFAPNEVVDLGAIHNSIMFKIQMTGNGNNTPLIFNLENVILNEYDVSVPSVYITKLIENVPEYNNVKMVFDKKDGSGTSSKYYVSPNDVDWLEISEEIEPAQQIDFEGFYRHYLELDFTNIFKVETSDDISGIDIAYKVISGVDGGGNTVTFGTPGNVILVNSGGGYFYVDMVGGDDIINYQSLTLSNDGGSTTVDVTITGNTNMVNNTKFRGKIVMTSGNGNESPIIKNLKFIMKKV